MLKYNEDTKIIFANDEAAVAPVREITEDEVPDLIANGAGVDPSADYAGKSDSSVGATASGETSESTVSQDAPAASDQAAPATGLVTGDDLGNAGADTTLSSGTAVEVTQVGDSTVNTAIQQSGNQLAGETGNQLVSSGVTLDAPALIVTNTEADLNPLVPAAGTEGPPASQLAAQAELPAEEEMPRESHLMLMESKFAALLDKLRNQERIALDELETVYAHVKAVL